MRKIIIASLLAFAATGCATKKIPVMLEASNVIPITAVQAAQDKCEFVKSFNVKTEHPNNLQPELKNQTYLAGANRYLITNVIEKRKHRPVNVDATLFKCPIITAYDSKPAGTIQLLPGANSVKPITFAEIENQNCKVLTTHMIEKTSPHSLEVELANETYMQGGNRFHITKIVDASNGRPTSVMADIYRCQHRTVAFEQ